MATTQNSNKKNPQAFGWTAGIKALVQSETCRQMYLIGK